MKKTINTNELLKNLKNGDLPGVYKITRKSDHKVYIGQTSQSIKTRLEQHIKNTYIDEDAKGIDAAIKREGADKFEYETVWAIPGLTTEQLWFMEATLIETYDAYNKGFNLTKGNHKGAYDALDLRNKHKVNEKICKRIEKEFKLDFRAQNILLIGNFDRQFVNYTEYMDSIITVIDAYEESEFIEKFNEVMDSMENKDFDIIISNSPYKIGATITKRIIDEIEFKEFVNLLPANEYIKRGKKYNLWQYVENVKQMFPVRDFEDAHVTSHCAKIQKTPNLYLSADEFEIENFIDPQMTKFFYENSKREHYAIDRFGKWTEHTTKELFDVNNSIIFSLRDMANGHMPYSKNVTTYKFNFEKSVDYNYLRANHYNAKGNFGAGMIMMWAMRFNTKTEKENFSKFMYSEDGFRFTSKIFKALNTDGGAKTIAFPKVDWTKEWTVEEILKDYGYTEKEIKEVMEDLKNFKGMNA